MEYVRKRKLQYVLQELKKGRRVLDVALAVGFDAPVEETDGITRMRGYGY